MIMMNFDSFIAPVWQLPVAGAERTGNSYINQKAKYHCFVQGVSLCERYSQETTYYDDGITNESAAILERPDCACKRCLAKWKREYQVEV